MVRKAATGIAAVVLSLLWAADRPREQKYQLAVELMESKGDIPGAIKAFEEAAKSPDRNLAARSLLYLGICHEKLGQDSAVNAYQRIVRDYADQPAVAQARMRLAALRSEAAGNVPNIIARRIETPRRNFDYTTDGQRLIYRDYASGEMIYGDLAGRLKRVLLKFRPGDMSWWAPSKDFSMVAIAFAAKPDRPAHMSVLKTDGSGDHEVVRNDEQGRKEGFGFDSVQYMTWSWDNRYLLVSVANKDARSGAFTGGGYILVVSVADGKRRRLVDVEGGHPIVTRFSPDGHFVAYEVLHPTSSVGLSTFVVPVAGGKPSLVHEERGTMFYLGLLDWTADGRYLAMTASAPTGPALHLFPVENGQAAGSPLLVRRGHFVAGNMWPSGALVSWTVQVGAYVVHVASLDADGKPGPSSRLEFGGRSLMPPFVVNWSPDSNQIVYTARNEDIGQSGGAMVRVRNLTTGEDREIYRSAARLGCVWPTESRLICGGPSSGDRPPSGMKMFSISIETGAIEQLRPYPGIVMYGQVSRDGRAFYIGKAVGVGAVGEGIGEFVRWEIETGQETVLERSFSQKGWFRVSPDERWLIRSANLQVAVRSTSGGEWKPLFTVNKAVATANVFQEFTVTPDSEWVVYRDVDAAGKHGLFRVPISGGAPARLGDFGVPTGQLGILEFSPDGGKILTGVLTEEQRELWMLQNFVPVSTKP